MVQLEIDNNGIMYREEREELAQLRLADKLRGADPSGTTSGRAAQEVVRRKRLPPGLTPAQAQRELVRLRLKGYPL